MYFVHRRPFAVSFPFFRYFLSRLCLTLETTLHSHTYTHHMILIFKKESKFLRRLLILSHCERESQGNRNRQKKKRLSGESARSLSPRERRGEIDNERETR